jgi:hypothetical protein
MPSCKSRASAVFGGTACNEPCCQTLFCAVLFVIMCMNRVTLIGNINHSSSSSSHGWQEVLYLTAAWLRFVSCRFYAPQLFQAAGQGADAALLSTVITGVSP